MFLPVSRRTVSLYPGEWRDIAKRVVSGSLVRGEFEEEFSERFGRYVGAGHAVPTGTGRFALSAILKACRIPAGAEVILPAYEDLSVPVEVAALGLVPVFVDVSPATQGVLVQDVLARVTDKTRAVVVAHLFGIPSDVPGLARALAGRGIRIIEDCAHAVGTRRDGEHVGRVGDAAFFSFHSTKPFMTFGGGMAVTRDPELARRIVAIVEAAPYPSAADILLRIASTYLLAAAVRPPVFPLAVFPLLLLLDLLGVEPAAVYDRLFRKPVSAARTDVRLANVQAMVGVRGLDRLEAGLGLRRANGLTLDAILGPGVPRPVYGDGGNRYFNVIFSQDMQGLRSRLLRRGVDTGHGLMRHCPASLGMDPAAFPNTLRMLEASLQIPGHEAVRPAVMERIARIVRKEAAS
ncbi:MAG: DegT/DnrJ/EryC1/StrS aminotransferase family protein [Elusimicrobiota bacterium]